VQHYKSMKEGTAVSFSHALSVPRCAFSPCFHRARGCFPFFCFLQLKTLKLLFYRRSLHLSWEKDRWQILVARRRKSRRLIPVQIGKGGLNPTWLDEFKPLMSNKPIVHGLMKKIGWSAGLISKLYSIHVVGVVTFGINLYTGIWSSCLKSGRRG
jgi:hypothetical protein